jgi:hypothetical protein
VFEMHIAFRQKRPLGGTVRSVERYLTGSSQEVGMEAFTGANCLRRGFTGARVLAYRIFRFLEWLII